MKITVLTDNKAKSPLKGEWGLSLYIEHNGDRILLDTGASPLFAENAKKCGISLEKVNLAFLSHAHYDHSNGFGEFFRINKSAKLYLSINCKENCYGKRWIFSKYIGIKKGYTDTYRERLIPTDGFTKVKDGIYILPHRDGDYSIYGKKNGLIQKEKGSFRYDSFNHEQSLVIRTENGLVIFNSCCHTGADNIISEVTEAFEGEKILALIGGFHLYKSSADDVLQLAENIRATGIKSIYTGHCTGDKAFAILKEQLGETANELFAGMVIEL
ncbi:MAG: MBL fold metallo-hydrolase [Ruminococcaceae bacterium]|nr:MBL fold metallo-hydrolase [Oscillospiraceae bacterium]